MCVATGYPWRVSALIWWLIPIVACTGALLYVWWSIAAKRRQNTYKSIAEYENFRSAFDTSAKKEPSNTATENDKTGKSKKRKVKDDSPDI